MILRTKDITLVCLMLFGASLTMQAQFLGGPADGFGIDILENSNSLFSGGLGDGVAGISYQSANSIYKGRNADGIALGQLESQNSIYRGDSSDWADLATYLYYHAWTGQVGSGWLVTGNWTDGIVPTDSIRVRIPSSAPNMPALNAGVFKVGTSDGASFTCRALWIEEGADMLGRINAFIENHNSIIVDGTFRWKNQAPESFINQPGASIFIRNGGVLKTDF